MLEGEAEFTFRGEKKIVRAGETMKHIRPIRLITSPTVRRVRCACSACARRPAQDEFFIEVGDKVATRTSPPPDKTEAERRATMDKSMRLAPDYKTKFLVQDRMIQSRR